MKNIKHDQLLLKLSNCFHIKYSTKQWQHAATKHRLFHPSSRLITYLQHTQNIR